MKLRLWKGYHSPELQTLIQQSWDGNSLLILCPPQLKDFSFLSAFPEGRLELHGQWHEAERRQVFSEQRFGVAEFPDVPVFGVFTSGTLSGTPRLVLYSRHNILASLSGIFALFDRSRIETVFCYPQAFHTFGLTLGYVAAHVMGWSLHTTEGKYSRTSHARRLELNNENLLTLGTPTHFFDLLLEAKGRIAPSYSCIIGGASVSRGLWLRIRDELRIAEPSVGYGCTEASPGITHLEPGLPPVDDGEIGRPLASISARMLTEGVEISGDSLCMAVIQDQHIVFPKSLIIRDRVEHSDRGTWLFRGRLDLQMNRGGAKYSLEAIERTLFDHAGICAVAIPVRDTRLGEDLGLAIALSDAHQEETLARASNLLRDIYALKLDAAKTRFVPEFPLNDSAKLDRNSIWTLFNEQSTIPS